MSVDDDPRSRRRSLRDRLERAEDLELQFAPGVVLSPHRFAFDHRDLLSRHEQEVYAANERLIPDSPPLTVPEPLCLGAAGSESSLCDVEFIRDGVRSAYLPGLQLQLKGCRPAPGEVFPTLGLDPVTGDVTGGSVPFGVLSEEQALRELLAYVIQRCAGLPCAREPAAVFSYGTGVPCYCLVFRSAPLVRLEHRLEYPQLTLDDLLAYRSMQALGLEPPGEIAVANLAREEYVAQRTRLLLDLQFAGGFRGILNSNLGNDVFIGGDGGPLAFVDFDTFHVIPVPLHGRGSESDLQAFVTRAAVEAMVGCLPIAAMIDDLGVIDDVPAGGDSPLVLDELERLSSSWRAYREGMSLRLLERGWPGPAVEAALDRATSTPAFLEAATDRMVCTRTLVTSYPPHESLYMGHGRVTTG